MARFEFGAGDPALMETVSGGVITTAETYFRLGLQYANGRDVERCNVEAHKWFNIAALKGERRAAMYRQDLAEEMSRDEMSRAQKKAREYLAKH